LADTLVFEPPNSLLAVRKPHSQCSKGFSQDATTRLNLGDLGKINLGLQSFAEGNFSAFKNALRKESDERNGPSSLRERSASTYLRRREPV